MSCDQVWEEQDAKFCVDKCQPIDGGPEKPSYYPALSSCFDCKDIYWTIADQNDKICKDFCEDSTKSFDRYNLETAVTSEDEAPDDAAAVPNKCVDVSVSHTKFYE